MLINYLVYEDIAKNLLFVDGITRCGKSLFSGIIPSLKRVEHINFFALLEQVVPAISFGTLDARYARALIKIYLNELVYNVRIARNTNFRYSDQSGIFNYKKPEVYFNRLGCEEGDKIVEELRDTNRIIPFQTHDMLVNIEHLNLLEIDYRMIELFRHPIDTIHSWFMRGWGERFSNDPRSFTLTIEYGGKVLPWYCFGYEEDWLGLKPMERCLHMCCDLICRSIEQYKKTTKKDRIHIISFEDFVRNPEEELWKICSFLGTERTVYTPHFLRLARCPRKLESTDREKKLSDIKTQVKRELFDRLVGMSDSYETNLYGLR